MEEWLSSLSPVYREAAELCIKLADRDPASLAPILAKLEAVISFYRRRQTDEFPAESLVVLKQS